MPRLLSYDFSLPYVDHPDEPTYYRGGKIWRGLGEQGENAAYFDGVPPAYLALHATLQPVLESLGVSDLAPTIRVLRLLSVVANLAALAVIALTARLAAGDLAGIVAGAAWGVSPLVLENGVYALPDPFIYLLTALALWLAVGAVIPSRATAFLPLSVHGEGVGGRGSDDERTRPHWCVWSVVAGLLAVLFKYPALPALLPGVMAALVILRRDRRRGLRYLVVQGLLLAGTAFWLVFIYGIDFNNLQREGAVIRDSGLSNFLNVNRLITNLYHVFVPLNPAVYAVVIAQGIAAFIVAGRRKLPRVHASVVGLCLPLIIAFPWLTNTFTEVTPIDIRYVLPATAAACVLLGMAVGQIVYVLVPQFKERQYILWPLRIGLALLLLVMFIPQITASWRLVQAREPDDWRVAVRQWVDVNLEPGTILVTQENHKTFNPFYGGIPYRHWVDWWPMDTIMEHSPEEWREDTGISYAVVPLSQWRQLQELEAGRDYLAQMLHLRDFVAPPVRRGPEVVVYRLWRMDVETLIHFGDAISLVGYDQSADQISPGDSVTFRFYWEASATPPDNYSLFIHLISLDTSDALAQVDGAPTVPERPTLTWDDPGETLISPIFTLATPPDLPSGEYRVLIGLYNYLDGQRLPITDADGEPLSDSLELARLTVR